jgi:pyruvate/2-oxoglutarate dehydrogenase complex dihydrolipoamide dehydrogenase (E3) component
VDGVFAIGDVTGGAAFTHISYDDYRILRDRWIDGVDRSKEDRPVPYTVFIDPQLGRIGKTAAQARTAGQDVQVARMPMSSVARAIETGETRGFMEAVVDNETGQILGATILGPEGGEIASLLQVAMMGNLRYDALRDGVFSHPTFAESLNNLFSQIDDEKFRKAR